MKKTVKKILALALIPCSYAVASFEPMDIESKAVRAPKAPQVPFVPIVMRSGVGTPVLHHTIKEEIEAKRRKEIKRMLVKEFSELSDAQIQEHRDNFMNEQLEMVPSWMGPLLPEPLTADLSQEITFVRGDSFAASRQTTHTHSLARFLNEIQTLNGNENLYEQSVYLVRAAFALKDATMEGKRPQDMRDFASHLLGKASQMLEPLLEGQDSVSETANAHLSVAQTYYWAGSLSNDAKVQEAFFGKAKGLQEMASRALVCAPDLTRAALTASCHALGARIDMGITYADFKAKNPTALSFYEWNVQLSLMQKQLAQIFHGAAGA
ncbi:MAG: hypothetical protein LCH26_04880 [Proteobacteria bacterium]|nr:hypothetical protein [Pseudomonadota bacterium]